MVRGAAALLQGKQTSSLHKRGDLSEIEAARPSRELARR